jgi:hypothetical protein
MTRSMILNGSGVWSNWPTCSASLNNVIWLFRDVAFPERDLLSENLFEDRFQVRGALAPAGGITGHAGLEARM